MVPEATDNGTQEHEFATAFQRSRHFSESRSNRICDLVLRNE